MDIHNDKVAYNGKVIKFQGKEYQLFPEESLKGCKGCIFIKRMGCGKELTKWCHQGFILKKVNDR